MTRTRAEINAEHRRRYAEQKDAREKRKRHEYYERTKEKFRDRYYAMFRTYYATSKDKMKDRRYQRQYGITLVEAKRRLKQQGGKCAICRCNLRRKEWCVDHDHRIGFARGVLCHECNVGLGRFGDSREQVKRALDYLNHWIKQMPVKRVTSGGKPAFRWGEHGKAYPYTPGNKASMDAAKKRAIAQGLAVARRTGTKPEL